MKKIYLASKFGDLIDAKKTIVFSYNEKNNENIVFYIMKKPFWKNTSQIKRMKKVFDIAAAWYFYTN